MSCDCDETVHPKPLDIPPGQSRLYRQIASFSEFRAAMLADAAGEDHAQALGAWSAREGTDLGLMLVEMWAWVADVLAFYDEVWAHESYVRTARLRDSVSGLVEVLAYVPAPATAATVELALFAEGRTAVTVPAGTAFRSGAVDGGPPQVFELESDVTIHPLRNEWSVRPASPATVDGLFSRESTVTNPTVVFDPGKSARWVVGDLMLVEWGSSSAPSRLACSVLNAEDVVDGSGKKYQRLTLSKSLSGIPATILPTELRFYRPGQTAGLWVAPGSLSDTTPTAGAKNVSTVYDDQLVLDGVYRSVRPGQVVLVTYGSSVAWYKVDYVEEVGVYTYAGIDGDGHTIYATIPATRLDMDVPINTSSRGASSSFTTSNAIYLTLHHRLVEAGSVAVLPASTLSALKVALTPSTRAAAATLAPTDTIELVNAVVPADDTSGTRFAITDVNEQSTLFDGEADLAAATLTPDGGDTGASTLTLPARVWGNLVTASRGESVASEVLGSGDAATASQSFELKKSPLTHLLDASSPTGVKSTLQVWVDGVLWSEVTSFYGQDADARVYRVSLDADGLATVVFGDGERGSRLPTGVGNVVASYRHGAGATVPEAGSIKQIAKAAPKLRGVRQPAAATGGSEAEDADSIRTYAPRQALIIDRAVSIRDFEAVAAAWTGVEAATATYTWDKARQRPVVRIWYIGDESVAEGLLARLRALSDPTTPFVVGPAEEVPVELSLEVTVDDAYVASTVLAAVAAALWDETSGPLAPCRVGVGAAFYFSRLRALAHSVDGVRSVRTSWVPVGSSAAATHYAITPGPGRWFRFYRDGAADTIDLNGEGYGLG